MPKPRACQGGGQWELEGFLLSRCLLSICVLLAVCFSSLIMGANLYAVFVGTLISVIEDANGSHREYCKRIDMLQSWMAQRQLPRALRRKLETYYEILFPGGHAFDDEEILSTLSTPLLEEVSRHKCGSRKPTSVPTRLARGAPRTASACAR